MEPWRRLETTTRKVIAGLKRRGAPLSPQETSQLLVAAHSVDILAADLATTLRMPSVGLAEIGNEMGRLMHDPEVVAIYRNELWPRWFQTHKTINGWESFELWAEAGRIAQTRART